MYWINTINTATGYTSGRELATDCLIGQPLEKWTVGANGNFYYQLTNGKGTVT